MPVITQRDRNRLAALVAIVKPANSLAARIESLAVEERAAYERWQTRHHQWITEIKAQCPDDYENPDAWLYEQTLEQERYDPQLRRDVETALYGNMPRILKTDTDDDAARKWMEIIQS